MYRPSPGALNHHERHSMDRVADLEERLEMMTGIAEGMIAVFEHALVVTEPDYEKAAKVVVSAIRL